MKLTEEQQDIVTENHNLIYWYASLSHLNLTEWYDLLAIELCYTVMKYDTTKGSLGNYFKLRCDSLVYKEYRKSQAQKRFTISVPYLENSTEESHFDNPDDKILFDEMIDGKDGDIIQMKYDGYTQTEMARKLGVSQSYVSKILRKLRERYNEVYR